MLHLLHLLDQTVQILYLAPLLQPEGVEVVVITINQTLLVLVVQAAAEAQQKLAALETLHPHLHPKEIMEEQGGQVPSLMPQEVVVAQVQ